MACQDEGADMKYIEPIFDHVVALSTRKEPGADVQ